MKRDEKRINLLFQLSYSNNKKVTSLEGGLGMNVKLPELSSFVDYNFLDFYGALDLFEKKIYELKEQII